MMTATIVVLSGTAYAADRKPTLDERAKIETQLKSLGFTSWDQIEFDLNRDVWEIDDARSSDGLFYDLKLSKDELDVVSKKQE